MFSFFKKQTTILPDEFMDFPPYTGRIKKGPIIQETPIYKRYTYIVKGVGDYQQLLLQNGFMQKSKVRYDRGSIGNYIIIEKVWNGYKLAFHKKK